MCNFNEEIKDMVTDSGFNNVDELKDAMVILMAIAISAKKEGFSIVINDSKDKPMARIELLGLLTNPDGVEVL